jgi:anti-sigma regulatory factor (Ser/Thr protein kinase)
LMPGMPYEEKEVQFHCGDLLLLSSDGLVEAHNQNRDMFGFPRLKALMTGTEQGEELLARLMQDLEDFTGSGYEQEDDITLLVLEREQVPQPPESLQSLVEFDLPSQPGNERQASGQVLEVLASVPLSPARRQRLETAVAEATMNAMEHGNRYQAELPVHIQVLRSPEQLVVRIIDHGGGEQIPPAETPDLDAKLAGLQSPRGWGLFLIQNMVDEMKVTGDSEHHIVDLVLNLKEGVENAE